MDWVQEVQEDMNESIIEILRYEGTETLIRMRTEKDYIDRSGALTSSMGYVVSVEGIIAWIEGFDLIMNGSAGQQGGRLYAEQLAKEVPKGKIALIVLAGADYAGHLESTSRRWKKGSPYKVVKFTEQQTIANIEKALYGSNNI
jgi:hypothetical protein